VLDVDDLVADCLTAAREDTPQLAVRDVLGRAIERASDADDALPATRAEFTPLHLSDELTVAKVVWAPGMWLQPHDHRIWAAIAIYGGQEDNTFYRRADGRIVESGGRSYEAGEIALLGDDVVHAVANPRRTLTAAIHVYGGNLLQQDRTDWDPETLEPEAELIDRAEYFEDWNQRLGL
jgi:predicted metal-dependent enzyme (double-stranded beta helix superfamily)